MIRKVMHIVGIVDTDELMVYISDDLFKDSMILLTLPEEDLADRYTRAVIYADDVEKVKDYFEDTVYMFSSSKDEMEREIDAAKAGMYGTLSTMAVLIGLLSVCMYLIMRSIYMNRMKEIGIYRAIGVSKGNMLYRSLVETGVVTTLSAFIGYLLSTAFCVYIKTVSAKAEEFLYFPWWIALIVLVLIYVICLFSGTLSVRSVLKRTPAEIMAKYDI